MPLLRPRIGHVRITFGRIDDALVSGFDLVTDDTIVHQRTIITSDTRIAHIGNVELSG